MDNALREISKETEWMNSAILAFKKERAFCYINEEAEEIYVCGFRHHEDIDEEYGVNLKIENFVSPPGHYSKEETKAKADFLRRIADMMEA